MGNCVETETGVGCAAQTRQNWDDVIRRITQKNGQPELTTADGKSDSAISKTIRGKTFFVAKGMSFQDLFEFKKMDDYFIDVDDWRNIIIEWLGAERTTVTTADGRQLDALWLETPPADRHAGAILFHANCAIALDMALWGAWYRQRGISALMVTMGGYAGSEGETTEMSSYFDADASVRHLLAKGIPTERMVVHGLSIGGGLASAAAVMHPGISCTVDQTFVSAREVAEVTSKMISKRVPTFAIEKVVNTCFPQGKADPRLPITTDAYDNLNKVPTYVVISHWMCADVFNVNMQLCHTWHATLPTFAMQTHAGCTNPRDVLRDVGRGRCDDASSFCRTSVSGPLYSCPERSTRGQSNHACEACQGPVVQTGYGMA